MSEPLAAVPDDERRLLRRERVPKHVEPMKAVLTDDRFSDPAWIFERKLDGIRCIATKERGRVRLVSRNDLSLNARFPEVVEALAADPGDGFVLDGEVVAFAGGVTSFAKLARRGRERVRVFLYAFDVLHAGGHDVRALPLRTRKAVLRRTVDFSRRDAVRLTPHRVGDGERLYEEACRKGWEGLIAKRAASPYTSRRSRDWLKLKCSAEQELVVGGYTAPKGARTSLGALLVGHFAGGRLEYAGKVGTGFDRAMLAELAERLEPLRRDDPPFAEPDAIPGRRSVTWVEPELVVQVGFGEWTRDGRLRHPRFLGVREDKDARDVVRERPS